MLNVMRSLRFLVVSVVLLGLIYPLLVTGIGHLIRPLGAQGSLFQVRGRAAGSVLIAQKVVSPGLFHPRPSAVDYNADGSGGSNLGPTNPALIREIRTNLAVVLAENPGVTPSEVPPDAVESSASGLDPDISLQNARIQAPRIARADGIPLAAVRALIRQTETGRFLGLFGEPMVNVNRLNLALVHRLGKVPRP